MCKECSIETCVMGGFLSICESLRSRLFGNGIHLYDVHSVRKQFICETHGPMTENKNEKERCIEEV